LSSAGTQTRRDDELQLRVGTIDGLLGHVLNTFGDRLVAFTENDESYFVHMRGTPSDSDYAYLNQKLVIKKYHVFANSELQLVDVCDPFRPLVGDICISAVPSGGSSGNDGTAGFSVTDSNGYKGFVTAEHVGKLNYDVYQPNISPTSHVGRIEIAANDNFIDASFARIDHISRPELYLLGSVSGALPFNSISDDLSVSWTGRGSRRRVDGKAKATGWAGRKSEQIQIQPPPERGDSGAAIATKDPISENWEVLGIIWCRILVEGVPESGIACNYDKIASTLNVTLNTVI